MFGNLRNIDWIRLRDYMHFFISHHPFCEHFENHTFNIWKLRFCKGCSFAYPGVIFGFIYALNNPLDPLFLINLAAFNIVFFFIVTIFHLKEVFKFISRLLSGIVSGFLLYLIFFEPWWPEKVIAILGLYSLVGLLHYYRIQSFKRTCTKACGPDTDLDTCEFLLPIRDKPSPHSSIVSNSD